MRPQTKILSLLTAHFLFSVLFMCCSFDSKAEKYAAQSPKPPVTTQVSAENPKRNDGWKGWTTFRGSERRSGRARNRGPRTSSLKWVFRTGGRIYADAAISPQGVVYVASHDQNFYAIDGDGRELWSYNAKGKIWTSPALAKDGTIYFGSDDDKLIALSPSGKEKWTFGTALLPEKGVKPTDGMWDVDTSPLVAADGTVIFGCHYYLYALRPNGMMRWRFQAGVDRVKIFSSPALGEDGTVYFGTQGNFFFALNQSAKVLWSLETGGDNDSTPAIGDDGTVFFGSDDGKVRAIRPGGNLLYQVAIGAPIRAPVAVGHDGTVFAATYGKKPFLVALDGVTGLEKWRFHIEPGDGAFYGIQSGALVDIEGYIYFGGRDHYVYCISPTGKLVWRYKTGDQVDASPVIGSDGTLYIGSDDKRLYAFQDQIAHGRSQDSGLP